MLSFSHQRKISKLIQTRDRSQSHTTGVVNIISSKLRKKTVTNFYRVPPNCRFEVDDFEEPWTYSNKFDYVHGREMEGSIRDHDQLFQRIYENLNPDGWCEMSSMEVNTYSDDDTHLRASSMLDVANELHGASKTFGKDMSSISTWKDRMERAGFVNVKEVVLKVRCLLQLLI